MARSTLAVAGNLTKKKSSFSIRFAALPISLALGGSTGKLTSGTVSSRRRHLPGRIYVMLPKQDLTMRIVCVSTWKKKMWFP